MKTREEIMEVFNETLETDKEVREAWHNREIGYEDYKSYLTQNRCYRLALQWVLGEADRFD